MQSCCSLHSCNICWSVPCFRYKTITDTHKKTGRGRTAWPYFEAMDVLLGHDPAIHLPVLVSAGVSAVVNVTSPSAATSTSPPLSAKSSTPPDADLATPAATSPRRCCKRKWGEQPPAWAERFLLRQQEQADVLNATLQRIEEEEKRKNDLFERFLANHQWMAVWRKNSSSYVMYSVCQKNPPWGLVATFPNRLGIFQQNFTCLLCVPIYARLQIFLSIMKEFSRIRKDYIINRSHYIRISKTLQCINNCTVF